ncbi:hypothetical protein ACT3S5_15735, partial [Halomonas sp. AOP31-B1-25]|uniref:hypothetical protein n=1 Tax=Halomonas sp. AOP31-B1-25 TaxID=3457694 RepID=UPI00403361BD
LPAGSNVDEEGKEAKWLIAPLYSPILCHTYCDLHANFLNIVKNQIVNKNPHNKHQVPTHCRKQSAPASSTLRPLCITKHHVYLFTLGNPQIYGYRRFEGITNMAFPSC